MVKMRKNPQKTGMASADVCAELIYTAHHCATSQKKSFKLKFVLEKEILSPLFILLYADFILKNDDDIDAQGSKVPLVFSVDVDTVTQSPY